MRVYLYFTLFFIFLVNEGNARQAAKGIIDLRKVDLANDNVTLEGEWEFYWNQLLPPERFAEDAYTPDYFLFPSLWNDGVTANGTELSNMGYATYRLRVILPPNNPPLSVSISHFYNSYDLFADGELIAENGVVGTTEDSSEPHWMPKTLRILPTSDTVELVLHISNFHHSKGGARQPIVLGSRDNIMHDSFFNISYDLLLSGCLIMSGLFFLGLYLFGQKESYVLAFGLFCLVFSYRFFGADNYALHILYPQLPWPVTIHFEYFTLFLAPTLFALYSYALFPEDSSLKVLGGFSIISGIFGLITVVFPPSVFTVLVEPYLFLMVATIVYVSYVYFAAARNKRDGANYALLSTMVVLMVFVYKIYIYLYLVGENRLITFIGFLSFFFFQSLNMFFRVTRALHKAREEAERASKTKSDFLSMMSHEIRTPMNAVIGLTNYLMGDKPKKEHREALSTLKFSAENLLVILNDILDLNKIEANRIEFEKVPVDMRLLVGQLRQVFERMAKDKGLYIWLDIDKLVDRPVLCDSTRTSQVLSNLISNAIKFTKTGGVELKVQVVASTEDTVTLKFMIADTGIGISPVDQQRIFESFTQASTSVTREYGGTGLGLTITRRLLAMQGVELKLKSEVGKGSEFYFVQTFECVGRIEELKEVVGEEARSRTRGMHILVVEDNKINVLVAEKFLKKWGFEIEVATNGAEAVEKVKAKRYDVILMDLQMPVMDGYEASKQIREMGVTSPIIALTASTLMDDREKVKRHGMNDHIIKPFNPEELQRKLTSHLSAPLTGQ